MKRLQANLVAAMLVCASSQAAVQITGDEAQTYRTWPELIHITNSVVGDRLLVAYQSGSNHLATVFDFLGRWSTNNGTNWDGYFTLPGTMINVGLSNQIICADFTNGAMWFRQSYDATNWTALTTLGTGSGIGWRGKEIQLRSGKFIFPYYSPTAAFVMEGSGTTWVKRDLITDSGYDYTEITVAEDPVTNNYVYATLRREADSSVWFYWSHNGGTNWIGSRLWKYGVAGNGWPSEIQFAANGNLVFTFEPQRSTGNYYLIPSTDLGQNDANQVTVHAGGTWATGGETSFAEVSPGNFVAVYYLDTDLAHSDVFSMGTRLDGTNAAINWYIDCAGGNDSNDGKTTGTAWRRHPYMNGFAGTYTHTNGHHFIFKGGVTWGVTNFQMHLLAGGSSQLIHDYYGVDKAWFTGGSWTRPVFDFQDTVIGTYTAGAGILVDYVGYVTFDNIEMKRHRAPTDSSSGFAAVNILFSDSASVGNIVENCYIHDWSQLNILPNTDAGGGIIAGIGGSQCAVINCDLHQTNSISVNGYAVKGCSPFASNLIHHVSNAYLGGGIIHDNVIWDIPDSTDPNEHQNCIYCFGSSMIYNNVIHDTTSKAQVIYLEVAYGDIATYYTVYNNVIWNTGAVPINFEPEQEHSPGIISVGDVFNNTIAANGALMRVTQRTFGMQTVNATNNQFISNTPTFQWNDGVNGYLTNVFFRNNLTQSVAQATGAGYVEASQYAPQSAGAPTVNTGLNLSSVFTTDLLGRIRSAIWDIGAYEFFAPSAGAFVGNAVFGTSFSTH